MQKNGLGFCLQRVLKCDADYKEMFVEGQRGHEKAILKFQKRQFPADEELIGKKLIIPQAEGEYHTSNGLFEDQNLVKKLSEAHCQVLSGKWIDNKIKSTTNTIKSLSDDKPELESGKVQWIENILYGNAEKDRRILEVKNEFVLVCDSSFQGQNCVETLHCLALVYRDDIKNLTDLTADHLAFLEGIEKKSKEAIVEKFKSLHSDQIRVFINYPPTYNHFHIHFTHINKNDYTGKVHLLSQVIQNIRVKNDYQYYQKVKLELTKEEDKKENEQEDRQSKIREDFYDNAKGFTITAMLGRNDTKKVYYVLGKFESSIHEEDQEFIVRLEKIWDPNSDPKKYASYFQSAEHKSNDVWNEIPISTKGPLNLINVRILKATKELKDIYYIPRKALLVEDARFYSEFVRERINYEARPKAEPLDKLPNFFIERFSDKEDFIHLLFSPTQNGLLSDVRTLRDLRKRHVIVLCQISELAKDMYEELRAKKIRKNIDKNQVRVYVKYIPPIFLLSSCPEITDGPQAPE